MIDLHCHLLPGIDDGPKTMAESLEMCRIAVADGITHAITTPHIHPGRWENTRNSIARVYYDLRAELQKNNIPLELGFAGEVRLTDQIMRQVENRDIPFYGEVDGYKIMLLEFPHGHIVPGSENLVQWLLERGIRPLIAHPERNRQLMSQREAILPFIQLGCWLQITAGSLLGTFGERARALAWHLIDEGLVGAVASDGHNSGRRKPVLSKARNEVMQRSSKSSAVRLFVNHPMALCGSQFSH